MTSKLTDTPHTDYLRRASEDAGRLRRLDALVAEHVLGMRWHHERGEEAYFLAPVGKLAPSHYEQVAQPDVSRYWGYIKDVYVKNYSTDIAAAWSVRDHIDRLSAVCEFKLSQDYEGLWYCYLSWASEGESCRGEAHNCNTAPLAISLAALNAVGVEV